MSSVLRSLVRYGYAPFMVLGLNAAAFLVVAGQHSYAWLALLLGLAFAAAFAAESIAPWHDEDTQASGEPSYEERLRDEVAMRVFLQALDYAVQDGADQEQMAAVPAAAFHHADAFMAERKKRGGGA